MEVAYPRAITRVLTLALVVCVLAAFVSPAVDGFRTHLRREPLAGKSLVQLSTAAPAAANVPAITAAVVLLLDFAQVPAATTIFQFVCVRLC